MKTTLDLPEDLIQAVKLRAVMQRRMGQDLVADHLRQGLVGRPVAQPPVLAPGARIDIGPDGLPLVRCQAGAPVTGLGVRELLLSGAVCARRRGPAACRDR
jgi:plasmid stability protein